MVREDGKVLVEREVWALEEDFLPTSPKDILSYLKLQGYKIYYDRKTKKPTTNEVSLEKLIEAHPGDKALRRIINGRKYVKGRGYLKGDLTLGRDFRLHPQFTNLPDTGRISCRKPNLQNQPQGRGSDVDVEIANAIRSTIIASPGTSLVELDWAAIEALLVGFFASDPSYVRISILDPHAFVASYKVQKPASREWPDDQLRAYLSWIKKTYPEEREMSKRCNHSEGYGIGVDHLAEVMECSLEEAKSYMDLRKEAFPLVHQWKEDVRRRAHFDGRLTNPFGYTRTFWEVFKPKFNRDGTPKLDEKGRHIMGLGKEAREALAFLPQSTAAAMMREALLELFAHPAHGKLFWLLVTIHDSILVEALEGHEEEVIQIMKSVMERTWDELGGLRVMTEAKVGKSWGEMKKAA